MLLPDRKDVLPIIPPPLEEQWLGNRRTRRKNKELRGNRISPIYGEYFRMANSLNRTADEWNQTINDQGKDLSQVVFQGKPFIHRWLDARYCLPEFLQRAHFVNLDTPFIPGEALNRLDDHDVFSQPIGGLRLLGVTVLEGTSLFDIEQMPLNRTTDGSLRLGKSDIRRINRMFRVYNFSPQIPQESTIRQVMVYLATQDLARPEERIIIPTSLGPLHQRMVAYLDYYKDLLTNFDLSFRDEHHFLTSTCWSRPWLPQAVGLFTIAKLGITPSSAISLFQTRAEHSWIAPFWWRKNLLPYLEMSVEGAVRRNSLPQSLRQYQHYDALAEQKVSDMLMDLYGKRELTDEEQIESFNSRKELMDELAQPHFKWLQDDIAHLPKRYLEVHLDGHQIIDKVMIASQNKQVLIFILKFKDGGTHLTLEVDKDQRVYGLPAKFVAAGPHSMDVLADILPPILENSRLRHETKKPVVVHFPAKNAEPRKEVQTDRDEPILVSPPRERYRPQRSKILTPISMLLEGPQPANVVPIEPPKFVVLDYSKDKIKNLLGKKSSDDVAERVMKAIVNFEHGRGNYKKMKEEITEGEDIWEIKLPHYRVEVMHVDGAFFALQKVGHRREIFNIRQRSRT